MRFHGTRGATPRLLTGLVLAALLGNGAATVRGASPKDPAVVALAAKGAAFLAANDPQGVVNCPGGRALIAYAIFKSTHDPNHPKVLKSVEELVKLATTPPAQPTQKYDYELGLMVSFLTELKQPELNPTIQALMQQLLSRQKPNGSWTYESLGDTSVTQYGVLAMWAARNSDAQILVPDQAVEAVANWLIRTQDPSGAWGYQGKDPQNYNRVKQEHIAGSIVMAGGGSLLMAANMLGFSRASGAGSPFAATDPNRGVSVPTTRAVDHAKMWEAIDLCERYWSSKGTMENDHWTRRGEWQYYMMYGMERYMSFRKEVLRIPDPAGGADWYNGGVRLLSQRQQADGSWANPNQPDLKHADTAFAILFLLRSTEEKIANTKGTGRGIQYIPRNFRDAQMDENGNLVTQEKSDAVKDMAGLLARVSAENIDVSTINLDSLREAPIRDKSQIEVLKENLRTNPDYKARILAVRAMPRTLDSVPVLIFALSDPDHNVSLEARNLLRRISRKVGAFGPSDNPNESEKLQAQKDWSEWYLSIRPDGEL